MPVLRPSGVAALAADVRSQEDRMGKAIADCVAAQLRSAFPEGAFTQVDVLGYGDDPDVEPGETAIRAFADANGEAIGRLHRGGQIPSIAWIPLIPDTGQRRAPGAVLWGFPSMFRGLRADAATAAPGFAEVRTRLGAADLATVDALITAGIASSGQKPYAGPSAASARTRPPPRFGKIGEIGGLQAQLQRNQASRSVMTPMDAAPEAARDALRLQAHAKGTATGSRGKSTGRSLSWSCGWVCAHRF